MKKKIKRALISALTLSLAMGAAGIAPRVRAEENFSNLASVAAVNERKNAYTVMNHYKYRMEKAFERSPDTFEAWINVPEGSLGGTIMGNLFYDSLQYEGTIEWAVDAIGRIKLNWDDGNFVYTFQNAHIDDGQWHHVAVVRDPAAHTFTLYVDGAEKDRVRSEQDDAVNANMPMSVGVDYRTFTSSKTPFEGYVRQITVYNGAIDEERIRSDMQTEQIADDYNGQIMGNWVFGEEWTERFLSDTTANENHAALQTFDKYVGVASEDFEYDYMLVGIPDVQTCMRYQYDTYLDMMPWLADHAQSKKMAFAWQVGDLSDVGSTESFYRDAAAGISKLDGKLPYSFVPGNHDYDHNWEPSRQQTYFDRYFPYDKYSRMSNFGGAYKEGSMANTYSLYEVCGVEYMVINLEYRPRKSVLRWAGRLCEMYPQRRVIVNTHSYMNNDGSFMTDGDDESLGGEDVFEGLVKQYDNIFMAFGGHVCSDDALVRLDQGVHGNTVASFLIDTQTATHDNGVGEDIVFLMKINEQKKLMSCYYYSPANDGAYNIQNQFEISFAEWNDLI